MDISMNFKVGDLVAYCDDDLGRQVGQVVRLIRTEDGNILRTWNNVPPPKTEVCCQVRWECDYPPDLPGSVHSSKLRALTPLELLAREAH